MSTAPETGSCFVRVAETTRPSLRFFVDGIPHQALRGDTIMTGLRVNGLTLRRCEFTDQPRAGFCLMGACQDCWVRLGDGQPVRACSTLLTDGMAIFRNGPTDVDQDGAAEPATDAPIDTEEKAHG